MPAFVELSQSRDLDAELMPLTPEQTKSMRLAAKTAPYPCNRLIAILADLADADRLLGGSPTRDEIERRWQLTGELDAERDKAAESFLSMLSLAIDRRPNEVAALLTPFLAKLFSRTWDSVTERLDALETAAAEQLEPAL